MNDMNLSSNISELYVTLYSVYICQMSPRDKLIILIPI